MSGLSYTIDEVRQAARLAHPLAVDDATHAWGAAWSAALDEAALSLIAHGCRDIMRVVSQSDAFHEELWVDCPAAEVGELRLQGRCVYRQTMSTNLLRSLNVGDDYTMTILKEWLAPELAPVVP